MTPKPEEPPLWFRIVIFGAMLVAVLAIVLFDGDG